jgi:hypothetical protein
MVKVLGVATIPAGLIAFDSMSLDDRGFQVGEEVSISLNVKLLPPLNSRWDLHATAI